MCIEIAEQYQSPHRCIDRNATGWSTNDIGSLATIDARRRAIPHVNCKPSPVDLARVILGQIPAHCELLATIQRTSIYKSGIGR